MDDERVDDGPSSERGTRESTYVRKGEIHRTVVVSSRSNLAALDFGIFHRSNLAALDFGIFHRRHFYFFFQHHATAITMKTPAVTLRQLRSQRSFSTLLDPIYVAATRQHVGKTSVSLALFSGLQKRFGNQVGFCKSVGQQSLEVNGRQVDKDAALLAQHFGLEEYLDYQDMSPVLIPPGYTRAFVDGDIRNDDQKETILKAFANVSQASSGVVLCEGTGHCAVGSIVEACNAQVAQWLGAKMVLVANGGLGKAFDELELNRSLCERYGVPLAGVIINKVVPEKYEQTKEYMTKVLRDRWDVPLLGCVPDRKFLGCPALADLERLFPGAQFISGHEHRLRHYTVRDLELVATSLHAFLQNVRKSRDRTLWVCHASRNDILLGFLMESQLRGGDWGSALVVTGCDEYPLSPQVWEIVTSMSSAPPVVLTPYPTRHVMELIHAYTPKLNAEDGHRVRQTIAHYEPYIDFDLLLERVSRGGDGERGGAVQ